MSDLLSRTKTGQKLRDEILAELDHDEQIMYALECQVVFDGDHARSKFGALLVTTTRLMMTSRSLFGKLSRWDWPLDHVVETEILLNKIAEVKGAGRSWKQWRVFSATGDDLKLLVMAIDEVRSAARQEDAVRLAAQMAEIRRQREL